MEDQNKKWEEAIAQAGEAIEKMSPEQRGRYEKAVSIIESIAGTAKAIANASKLYPSSKKRIFPKISRRPRNKQKRAYATVAMHVAARMGAARTYAAIAQPIPKYPNGSTVSGNIAIVGERGPEMVSLPGGNGTRPAHVFLNEAAELPRWAFCNLSPSVMISVHKNGLRPNYTQFLRNYLQEPNNENQDSAK